MQAIALAGGQNNGGNLRQIVIFRRDKNWRLMAIKLDLAGGMFGKRPLPSDEIWLRDSDIILIPKLQSYDWQMQSICTSRNRCMEYSRPRLGASTLSKLVASIIDLEDRFKQQRLFRGELTFLAKA